MDIMACCSATALPLKSKLRITTIMAAFSMAVLSLLVFQAEAKASGNDRRLLTLEKAIQLAQDNDDWLEKSQTIEDALISLSKGADAVPDPSISISLLNLPSDGLAFDQEPMTQFKVGASQQFARGATLELEKEKLSISAQEQPLLRENRKQQVALLSSHLWLDAFQANASYTLIDEARPLFDKLGDIVSASYASSSGAANQQDIIRAELELVRLNDRLISLKTAQEVAKAKLSEYLFDDIFEFSMPDVLPEADMMLNNRLQVLIKDDSQQLANIISQHPAIAVIEKQVELKSIDSEIARESKKPQYGVNASYAFRDDSPEGQSRADFFSIGLTMSVSIFSSARQDAKIQNSIQMAEAIRTEKRLQIKQAMAQVRSIYAGYLGLQERLNVYEQGIIPQMQQQSEAALNAYTNDVGDFAEVVRAKIAELDAQLTLINIQVSIHKKLTSLAYHLPNDAIRSNIALVDGLKLNAPKQALFSQHTQESR